MVRSSASALDRPGIRIAAFLVVAVWGLYQCFWNLLGSNIAGDESIYISAGWDYVHGDFADNREHPPFAKYLFGLAQLVLGQGALGPRLVVAVLVFAVAVVAFLWLRRHIGFWAGLTAAGLWLLTPRGGVGTRVDRIALLDPVMAVFALFALAAAWAWVRTDRWWLAPVSGALMALSVTSKVSTVVLLPAFLLLPVFHRAWRKLLIGGLLWVLAFGVVFVVVYLPMGIRSAIEYMVVFQNGQNTNGHPITIDGHVYTFAPWWANPLFFERGVGVVMTVVIVVGLIAALVVRPDVLVAYLATALGCMVVFYVVVAKIALPHYYEAWMPVLLVLTAIGYARLGSLPPRTWTSAVAALLVLVSAVPAVGLSRAIATAEPTGIALVDGYLRSRGVDGGTVLFVSATPTVYRPYFADRGTMDVRKGPFTAVVVGGDPRFPAAGTVTALIRNDADELVRRDVDGLVVYTPKEPGTIADQGAGLTVVH